MMKGRTTPVITGVFVLGALFLAVVGVISFGGGGFWRETREFVIFFDESVHGLERGSPVKLQGVPVGRVASVNVAYHGELGAVAMVVCELEQGRIMDPKGKMINLREAGSLRKMVEEGLRGRLNLIGITGMLFIEMNFVDPVDGPRAFQLPHEHLVVVPSTRSTLFGVTEGMTRVVAGFEAIDFPEISQSIISFLNTAEETLHEARLKELIERMTEAVEAVTEVARAEELRGSLLAAREAFDDFGKVARVLEARVDEVGAGANAALEDARRTLEEMDRTLALARESLNPETGAVPQLVETLESMREAARSVQRLADFLERHPQAILGGRKDP